MTLKQMGKHYQKTGEFLPSARKAEREYVKKNIYKWYLFWKDNMNFIPNLKPEEYIPFEEFIGVQIGLWECRHGFTRSYKDIKNEKKK